MKMKWVGMLKRPSVGTQLLCLLQCYTMIENEEGLHFNEIIRNLMKEALEDSGIGAGNSML